MKTERLEKLASERNNPCVTISMNTHPTLPDKAQDMIVFRTLLKEAEEQLTNEYGNRSVSELLDNIDTVENEIDVDGNLESLHVFLSNSTKEIIRLPWPAGNAIHIAGSFAIHPLIKAINLREVYLLLFLSGPEVKLFGANKGTLLEEISNMDFPVTSIGDVLTSPFLISDGNQPATMVREFLKKVDKGVAKLHCTTGMNCLVNCSEYHYDLLIQVSENPGMYDGYVPIHDSSNHSAIAAAAWQMVTAGKKKEPADEVEISEADDKLIGDDARISEAQSTERDTSSPMKKDTKYY